MSRTPPYDTGRVKIGLFHEPTRRPTQTWSESQIQSALLDWQSRSGNDSNFGGDMHPLAEQQRKRAERRSKRVKRSVHKALRSAAGVVVMLVRTMVSEKTPKL
jgi:hypothetical protein